MTWVLEWMNGFIYSLYAPPVITRNYSAIATSTLYNPLVTQNAGTITVSLNYIHQMLNVKSSLHSRPLATNSALH
jgi:hypothetical protein